MLVLILSIIIALVSFVVFIKSIEEGKGPMVFSTFVIYTLCLFVCALYITGMDGNAENFAERYEEISFNKSVYEQTGINSYTIFKHFDEEVTQINKEIEHARKYENSIWIGGMIPEGISSCEPISYSIPCYFDAE